MAFLRWPSLLGSPRSFSAVSSAAGAASNVFGSLAIMILPNAWSNVKRIVFHIPALSETRSIRKDVNFLKGIHRRDPDYAEISILSNMLNSAGSEKIALAALVWRCRAVIAQTDLYAGYVPSYSTAPLCRSWTNVSVAQANHPQKIKNLSRLNCGFP
jgi:hypothetical protein